MKATNKIALITGGSSGIGKAMADVLAKRKYNLLLVSNQMAELAICKAELELNYGITCHTFYLDLSTDAAASTVYEFCIHQKLEIDILINNAGMLLFSEVHQLPVSLIDKFLYLHLHTPTLLCKFFADDMIKRKAGFIINISSISSVMPFAGISLYGPTKTYLRYFSKALRHELTPHNVHVCCVLPGATHTSMYNPDLINIKLAKLSGLMRNASFVAKQAIDDAFAKKGESIPGLLNKLTVLFIPFLPNFLISLLYNRTKIINKLKAVLN